MNRYRFSSLLLFLSLAFPLSGQTAKISGYVRDAESGDALPGANVFIEGTSLGAAADENGFYRIPSIAAGRYIIETQYIGYLPAADTLTVIAGLSLSHDFNLSYTMVEGEEVTVTAQAKGQMDAINRQLAAKSLMNVVSSDRIQDLPDANAAESVARVPGVTIQREGGEGNKVVIRGLSPKYNAISVDGVRLAATDSSDRSTDLSMISQYMLEGIEVTKAGTPDLDADVLGGTVNFRLKRADPGLHIGVLTQGMYNGLKSTYEDYKLVLDISNRFWGDRIGVLALIDLENRNRSSQELGVFYDLPGAQLDSTNSVRVTNLNIKDIIRLNRRQNNLVVVDLNIPSGNISFSDLNSSINKDGKEYSESYSLGGGDNSRRYFSGIGDGEIGVSTQTLQYEQTLFSKLQLNALASQTRSSNSQEMLKFRFDELYAYTESTQDVALSRIQEITKNDTGNTYFSVYDFYDDFSEETETTYSFDLGYNFRLFNFVSGKLKAGSKIRKKNRTFDKDYEYAPITYVGTQDARDSLINHFPRIGASSAPNTVNMTYWPFIDQEYESGEFLDNKYHIGPFADLDFMEEIFQFYRKNFSAASYHEFIMHRFHKTNSLIYDYKGEENYSAYYFMLDLDIGSKFNIITGARSETNETTYQSVHGWQNVLPHFSFAGSDSASSHNRKNEFLLPAMFIRYKPFSWLDLRFARTQTLTRPSYADIIPLYHILGASRSVEYRNPYLEPALSNNQDFSITVNQNYLGLVSLAYFEKSIDGLIYSSGRRYIDDAGKFGLPNEIEKGYIQNYTSNNPHAVKLNGIEIDYQARFWYLPGLLKGLVFNANYTITQSEVKYPRTTVKYDFIWDPKFELIVTNIDTFYVDRLIDQPNEIINFSIGYDYKGFSGRLSMLHKSDVFRRTDFWPELRETSDDYTRWDLSLKQKLPVAGVEMFFNLSNITESVDRNRLRGQNALSLEQYYGRTIDVGLRYSYR